MASIFDYLGPLMTSPDHITIITDITVNFANSLTTEQHNAADKAINVARENMEWIAYHGNSIFDWLTANVSGAASGILINCSLLSFAIISLSLLFV